MLTVLDTVGKVWPWGAATATVLTKAVREPPDVPTNRLLGSHDDESRGRT